MVDISVKYLGLKLKSPLIVGASTLSADVKTAKELEIAGAGAIVLKSLFEEQIQMERAQLDDQLEEYAERNAEMTSIFPKIEHSGPREHLLLLDKLKSNLSIPVIASLNCVYSVSWVDYAERLEEAGADALELNFYSVPSDLQKSAQQIEKERIKIIKSIASRVDIPISVKLSPCYTNVLNVVQQMKSAGAKGFILFNRLFQPEIDVKKEKHITHFDLSPPSNYKLSLRYVGLLYNKIDADMVGNGGLYSENDILQMILSGANSVQVVSAVYKNKAVVLSKFLAKIQAWMKRKGYRSIDEFRGKLSDANLKGSYAFKRAQYLDFVLKPDEIIKKYPMR